MALRQHDIVLADGRFRVVLTDRRRLFAVIDAPETALGPLRIAFEIDRRAQTRAPEASRHSGVVGGILDDLGRGLSHLSSDGAFKAVSSLAPTLAPPAFTAIRDAAAQANHLLNQQIPLLPEGARKPIESAARIVLRARLGDLSAKGFIERVVGAVRSGADGARPVSDALIAGSRLVKTALGPPTASSAASPDAGATQALERVTSALERADFGSLATVATDAVTTAEQVTETLDDYVKHFTTGAIPLLSAGSGEPAELRERSSRFIQPLSCCTDPPALTTVGSVGDVLGVVGDAASGNIGGAVGGAAGGSLAKGAAIGSAIGSVIPGVGTVIGGAVGALIGGIGSLFGGSSSGPMDIVNLPMGLGHKLVRQIADKIRHAPRWQAHAQAVYRHLPSGTAGITGINDHVWHELFPHDAPGKDATTGHPDGLAEWFARQPDWERLLHGPGVPPGDRHQLEARIHALQQRAEVALQAWLRRFQAPTARQS